MGRAGPAARRGPVAAMPRRASVVHLITARGLVDLVIPRGGAA